MALNFKPVDRREDILVIGNNGFIQADFLTQRGINLYRLTRYIWLAFGTLEALIGLRIVLKFMAASPEAGFAKIVYGLTSLFLRPFASVTVNPTYGAIVLELTSMIAMIVYALGAWILVQAVRSLFNRARTRRVAVHRRTQ